MISERTINDIVDAVLDAPGYAAKVIPMGGNPPLFDGMQPDFDGPWINRIDAAKRVRAALQAANQEGRR